MGDPTSVDQFLNLTITFALGAIVGGVATAIFCAWLYERWPPHAP